jgi:hypothetical protein
MLAILIGGILIFSETDKLCDEIAIKNKEIFDSSERAGAFWIVFSTS